MSGRFDIQRYPASLLGLLSMKSTGDAPHELQPMTQLSLESLDMYLLDRRRFIKQAPATAAGTAAGVGWSFTNGGATVQVPEGELWYVYGCSMNCTTAQPAGTSARCALYITHTPISGGRVHVATSNFDLASLDTCGTIFERPIIMTSGAFFGGACLAVTGAPTSVWNLDVVYAPVPV
jgi:hypothetical protein